MHMKTLAAIAAGLFLAAPAQAVPINDFSSLYFIGDSLSDVGNVYDATRGREPKSPPYWHGRFSNGRIWADRVSEAFKDEGVRTGNLAWGGALADGAGVPDIGLQASQYRLISKSKRGDDPIVAIWGGGNDIINAAGKGRAAKEGKQAAMAIGDAANSLRRAGVHDLLIVNMPDIGAIPKFGDNARKSASASRASRTFNRYLDAEIASLRDKGANVYEVDAYGLFADVLADPESFGLNDVTTPCLDGNKTCTRSEGNHRAFFDKIHPNRKVHRALSEAALAAISGPAAASMAVFAAPAAAGAYAAPTVAVTPAPVPLPASGMLLIAGVGLIGVWQVRRRQPVAVRVDTRPRTQ